MVQQEEDACGVVHGDDFLVLPAVHPEVRNPTGGAVRSEDDRVHQLPTRRHHRSCNTFTGSAGRCPPLSPWRLSVTNVTLPCSGKSLN
eukprot:554010-Amphidinium_carterae.1